MNSFDHSWNHLAATARRAAVRDFAPACPAEAWVTRVAALGAAECAAPRGISTVVAAWALPGFGVAALLAVAVTALSRPVLNPVHDVDALVALADPLADRGLLP